MEAVREIVQRLKTMRKRTFITQLISFGLIVSSALMIWKGLMVASGSESPVVVVLSESMEPAIQRGDILFLWLGYAPFRVGEIIVFKIKGREIPIIHRILEVHEGKAKVQILTKGDNNSVDDRGLYNPGQLWLEPDDVLGRAKAYIPYVGMVTIILTDYPALKVLLVGLMGIFVITGNEEK